MGTYSISDNVFLFFYRDGIVSTAELFEAIQKMRNAPNEVKTQRLLEVLDDDKDGEISLDELRKVGFELGWFPYLQLKLNAFLHHVLQHVETRHGELKLKSNNC